MLLRRAACTLRRPAAPAPAAAALLLPCAHRLAPPPAPRGARCLADASGEGQKKEGSWSWRDTFDAGVGYIKDSRARGEKKGAVTVLKDGARAAREQKAQAQQTEMFQNQVQSLLALRVFTLDDFVNQMEAGLEAIGANSMVRGQMVKNNPEITGLREAIELLRALPPADRAASVGGATAHISPDRRQAACEQANVGTERMSQVIKDYENAAFFHGWLHKRKAAGLALPSSQKEVMALMKRQQAGKKTQQQQVRKMKRAARRRRRR